MAEANSGDREERDYRKKREDTVPREFLATLVDISKYPANEVQRFTWGMLFDAVGITLEEYRGIVREADKGASRQISAAFDDIAVKLATLEGDPTICESSVLETWELCEISLRGRHPNWTEEQYRSFTIDQIKHILGLLIP
jgi:hypothetical protein